MRGACANSYYVVKARRINGGCWKRVYVVGGCCYGFIVCCIVMYHMAECHVLYQFSFRLCENFEKGFGLFFINFLFLMHSFYVFVLKSGL